MAATVASIRKFGDRCLRRPAAAVDPGSAETMALRETLWATLAADGGVGLAAPQIGCRQRVIVVRDPRRPSGQQRIDLVNPVIRETFGSAEPFLEGCLSFPGLFTTVLRPRGVVVDHDVPAGKTTLKVEGLVARIIQHEVDHLDGVLFIDHLTAGKRLTLLPRLACIYIGGWVARQFAEKRVSE